MSSWILSQDTTPPEDDIEFIAINYLVKGTGPRSLHKVVDDLEGLGECGGFRQGRSHQGSDMGHTTRKLANHEGLGVRWDVWMGKEQNWMAVRQRNRARRIQAE